MNIEKLFSTRQRARILQSIIFSEKKIRVNETAKRLKLSKGLISKYFEILVNEEILARKSSKFIVRDNNKVKSIKIMLNVGGIDSKIFKKFKFVKIVGLYGSRTKGLDTEFSDVDLWIKTGKAKVEEISDLTSEVRKKIKNAKILVFDDKKLQALKKQNPLFYHSLHFGSIILYSTAENSFL